MFPSVSVKITFTYVVFSCVIPEAIQWEKQPNKPTIVVQDGVRNKNVKLEWRFILGAGESLSSVIFKRKKSSDLLQETQLASRSTQSNAGKTYTVSEKFRNEYTAKPPAILTVLDANNEQEYVYTVEVSYLLNSGQLLELSDHVSVIVYGE